MQKTHQISMFWEGQDTAKRCKSKDRLNNLPNCTREGSVYNFPNISFHSPYFPLSPHPSIRHSPQHGTHIPSTRPCRICSHPACSAMQPR